MTVGIESVVWRTVFRHSSAEGPPVGSSTLATAPKPIYVIFVYL